MPSLLQLALHPDRLTLIALGPGDGECIMLHVPPGEWLIVDCFSRPRTHPASVPALEVVSRLGGRLMGAILTHPHDDHAEGFDRVVARTEAWVGCVENWVPGWNATSEVDTVRALYHGLTETAIAAIDDRWRSESNSRFSLVAGARQVVGEAEIEVLHPDRFSAAPTLSRANQWSSAVLVTWRQMTLLLGADLPKTQWAEVRARVNPRDLAIHTALKVPHHASNDAMAVDVFGSRGRRDRVWIATPKRRMPHPPRFEDGHGIEEALKHVDEVALTTVLMGIQKGRDGRVARSSLAKMSMGGSGPPKLPNASPTFKLSSPKDPMEAWVSISCAPNGALEMTRGDAAVLVYEA